MTRKELRKLTDPYASPSTTEGLAVALADLTVFGLCFWAALSARSLPFRAIAGLLEGLWIARLFILGHDACHGSLCRSRWINRIAGRLLFLPSLTPYSLWEIG